MTKDGVGIAGCRENVTLCMTARRNIMSEDRLQSQGYGLWLIGSIQIVRLYDAGMVLEVERVNGMPQFRLQDVLEWPRLNTTGKVVCFSDDWPRQIRIGSHEDRVCEWKCIDRGFQTWIVYWDWIRSKTFKTESEGVCGYKWCAQSKITKRSFGVKEHVWASEYLEQVTADIAVHQEWWTLWGQVGGARMHRSHKNIRASLLQWWREWLLD